MEWLVFAVAVVAVGLAWWRHRRSSARQRRLMLLCQHAGLAFAPLDLRLDTAWLPFPMFGHPKHGTENVVWDRRLGEDVHAFDLWYVDPADDRSGGARRTLTCAVVPLRSSCPRLRVAPRDVVDDLARAFGGEEVRLELEEFDRRFLVETEDVRFAFAFLDQRLMETFLGLPDGVTADVNEDVLLLWVPRQVLVLFDAAVAIRRRIPRVVTSLFPPRPERGAHERRWLQGRWSPESTGSGLA